MNTWPTLSEWCRFGIVLTLELLTVFAVAKLLTLRLRSAQWRRALWQSSLIAMLLITLGELNGVRSLVHLQSPAPALKPQRAVIVTIKDPDLSMLPPALNTIHPASSPLPRPVPLWERRMVWPALAWLIGLALVFSRSLLAQAFAMAFRFPSRRVNAADLNERTHYLSDLLGIRRPVALAESARAVAPFTFGIWKPVIVLPKNFSGAFTSEQRDVALAHELAHVANYDSAWRAFSQFVCALLWWHPVAWMAKRELDHASELVADEASLLITDGPNRLAECLVTCAKQLRKPALVTWLGMDGGGFRSALGQRVARLLQLKPHANVARGVSWLVRILVPMIFACSLWLVVALFETPSHRNDAGWRSSIIGNAVAGPPDNAPAAITQSRSALLQTNRGGLNSLPGALPSTNAPVTSAEQMLVAQKLRQIRFAEYGPIDNLPLSEVIRSLNDEALRRDPEKKGVNFFLTSQAARQLREEEATDVDGITVRLGMKLRDITLEQVLRIVIDAAERPIQVSVEDYGVLITPVLSAATPILTRMFKVDPTTFVQNLEAIERSSGGRRGTRSNPDKDVIRAVTRYLNKAGVDFNKPGRSIMFNDRTGTIAVRATADELDTVEKMVQMANTSPQQLTLQVKVMEVSLASSNAAWEWFVGEPLRTNAWSGKNPPNSPTVTGILTDEQFRAAVRNLEKRGGTDLLSAPEVTTMSGRQAQIKVVDIRYIVTDLDIDVTTNAPGKRGSTNTSATTNANGLITRPIAEPFEIGPVVDMIPTVMPDGYTIQLWVEPSLREFLGYDDPGSFVAEVRGDNGEKETQPVPLPKFRLRKAAATAVVWDGQTLVICAGTVRHEERVRERNRPVVTNYTDKALFFFVTPRLIDAAGNPLHSNEELAGVQSRPVSQEKFIAPR